MKLTARYLTVALLTVLPQHTSAQVLPQTPIVAPPAVPLPIPVIKEPVRAVTAPLKPVTDPLQTAGQQVADRLLTLPDRLPLTSPSGQPVLTEVRTEQGWRAVEREWLLVLTPQQWAQLAALPLTVLEKTELDALQLIVVRIRAAEHEDSLAVLQQQLPEALQPLLGRHHIYEPQYQSQQGPGGSAQATSAPLCHSALAIGMLDTAIDTQHPAFAQARIKQQAFSPKELAIPKAHGTAVAGVLVGQLASLQPRLQDTALLNAAIFYQRDGYSQGAPLLNLVSGLNWLVQQQVRVINLSLTGPANPVLAAAVTAAQQQGVVLVAAAGNQGPASAPLYPAAYQDVVAVTAVDAKLQIYRWANQGDYIDVAAPGVSVLTARGDGSLGAETGTSMAAPVVAAHLLCALQQGQTAPQAVQALFDNAKDLGETGRDPVFGYGLIE